MSDVKVLIIGAGLGGLTLAQSLRRAGMDAQIFERDGSAFDRMQGYRLHLDGDALNAAREVLPRDLHAVFEATSFRTRPFTTILNQDLSVAKRLPTKDDHGAQVWPVRGGPPAHANVDRATLRQILLTGLEAGVHFGKTLERYESSPDGVIAYFTDGTNARGDVLVGADGIRSAVRRQRAPHAMTVDTGITAIYGRVPLAAASPIVPKEGLEDIFTIATDERKAFLGIGTVRFPQRPDQAAAHLAHGTALRSQDDYAVCIVGGRHEYFPNLHGKSGAELQHIAAGTLGAWPARAITLIRAGDPAAFFGVEMYTSVPCELDSPTNVTLLGDAIHAMTPTLGRGANIAMRDGAILGRSLRKVPAGTHSLAEALDGYERAMLDYGFPPYENPPEWGICAWPKTRCPFQCLLPMSGKRRQRWAPWEGDQTIRPSWVNGGGTERLRTAAIALFASKAAIPVTPQSRSFGSAAANVCF